MNNKVSIEDVIKRKPCFAECRDEAYLRKLAPSGALTWREVADMPRDSHDKLWVLLREEFFTNEELIEIAKEFVKVAKVKERHDPFSVIAKKALNLAEMASRGEIEDEHFPHRDQETENWITTSNLSHLAAMLASTWIARSVPEQQRNSVRDEHLELVKVRLEKKEAQNGIGIK